MICMRSVDKSFRIPAEAQLPFPLSLFCKKTVSLKALDSIDLTVDRGEIVGYVGMNGAGKTTTMKLLSGILRPDSGDIKVNGFKPFLRKKEFLKSIGFVTGNKHQLWWALPPIETFRLTRDIYGIPEKEFCERIDFFSDRLGIEKILNIPVRKMSLGQRMKCEITASLLHYPQVIFLDEPGIGLDVFSKRNLFEFLETFRKETGATVLITSHNLHDIEKICDRMIMIHEGNIIFRGDLNDLRKASGVITCDKDINVRELSLEELVVRFYEKNSKHT